MNDMWKGNKEKIKVLVPLGAPPLASKKVINGITTYDGLMYDIWKQMKPLLEKKYDFEEYYVEQTIDFEYDQQIQDIFEGKYDISISGYSVTPKRLKLVSFSNMVIAERNAILHYPRNNYWTSLYVLITDSFIKPFLFILLICIIIGWLLNKIQPNRWNNTLLPKYLYLRKTIMVVISIIFGQGGLLEGKTTHSIHAITILLMALFISTVYFLYLQAIITDKVININKNYNLNVDNVGNDLYLVTKGNAIISRFEKINVNAKTIHKDEEDDIKYYIKNKDKYGGILMTSIKANYFNKKYPELIVSDKTFGFLPIHFPINKHYIHFIDDINEVIASLHYKNNILNTCRSYSQFINSDLCNL